MSFKTHTYFKKATSAVQRLEICNELNTQNFMVTAYVRDDMLCLDHALMYREGLLRETFVCGCRQFVKAVKRESTRWTLSAALICRLARLKGLMSKAAHEPDPS